MFDIFLMSVCLKGWDISGNLDFPSSSLNNDTTLCNRSSLSFIGMIQLLHAEYVCKISSVHSSTAWASATISLNSHHLSLVIKEYSGSTEHTQAHAAEGKRQHKYICETWWFDFVSLNVLQGSIIRHKPIDWTFSYKCGVAHRVEGWVLRWGELLRVLRRHWGSIASRRNGLLWNHGSESNRREGHVLFRWRVLHMYLLLINPPIHVRRGIVISLKLHILKSWIGHSSWHVYAVWWIPSHINFLMDY